MMPTSSTAIRALVASGRLGADEAVDRLLDAGEHGGERDCAGLGIVGLGFPGTGRVVPS